MLKKIGTVELKPGMFVVDTGISWLENPYLYAHEGLVGSESDVRRIRDEGYLEVFIDTRRSLFGRDPDGVSDEEILSGALQQLEDPGVLEPQVPVAEEMRKATVLYDTTVRYARGIMDEMRDKGVVDMSEAEPLVDSMLGSITRNTNALVGLAKLRNVDEYTYTHCINVGLLSMVFGRHLGFGPVTLARLGLAGLFHDLGKARIPDDILKSPRRLSPDEFEVMKGHPGIGFEYMRERGGVPEEVLEGVYEHHEKHNGLGYPRGLRGEQISVAGRILAVVDVYDALTSRRVYKEPMLPHKALSLMYGMRGQDFSPGLVERFIRCLGIYPVGSVVELNTGQRCVVSEANLRNPLQPRVLIVHDSKGRPCAPRPLDLAGQTAVRIATCLDPVGVGIDPGRALGAM